MIRILGVVCLGEASFARGGVGQGVAFSLGIRGGQGYGPLFYVHENAFFFFAGCSLCLRVSVVKKIGKKFPGGFDVYHQR